MIAKATQRRLTPPPPDWWQRGAMALLLVDLQQGTCGDAQPLPQAAFDQRFRHHTLRCLPGDHPRAPWPWLACFPGYAVLMGVATLEKVLVRYPSTTS